MLSKSTTRSKRQPLPLLWTRIIDLDQDEEIDIESFEIDEDILTIDDEPDD